MHAPVCVRVSVSDARTDKITEHGGEGRREADTVREKTRGHVGKRAWPLFSYRKYICYDAYTHTSTNTVLHMYSFLPP